MVVMNTQGVPFDVYGEELSDNSYNDEPDLLSPTTPAPSSVHSSPEAPPFSPLSPCVTLSQSSDAMSIDSEAATIHDHFQGGVCTATQTEAMEISQEEWFGFKIVGDNIDKNVRPRHQSLEVGTKSLHYFHAFAALDRINLSGFSEQRPSIDPIGFDLEKLLPSLDDICKLKRNFQVHVARIITTYLPCLTALTAVTTPHIKHKYFEEMSKKSVVVCV